MPTVLVVDDDDDVREVTAISLSQVGGWEVLEACCGQDAVDLAHARRPDAILLDLMMPGMDGIATFGALQDHESTQSIPVIMLTAKARVGDRQPWDGLAIAGVLSKPFSPMTLSSDVSAILGWSTAAS